MEVLGTRLFGKIGPGSRRALIAVVFTVGLLFALASPLTVGAATGGPTPAPSPTVDPKRPIQQPEKQSTPNARPAVQVNTAASSASTGTYNWQIPQDCNDLNRIFATINNRQTAVFTAYMLSSDPNEASEGVDSEMVVFGPIGDFGRFSDLASHTWSYTATADNQTLAACVFGHGDDSDTSGDETGYVHVVITDPPVSPPIGSWIAPGNGQTFSGGTVVLSAHASAGAGVDHVDFTSPVGGNWHVLCGSATPSGDVYSCGVNLAALPMGDIEIAFDVYARNGARVLSPDGHRTIHYFVPPPTGSWITPGNGQTFSGGTVILSAHASAADGVDHVDFTSPVGGDWHVLCGSASPSGDIYSCGINLAALPTGDIEIAFDVYSRGGARTLSPDGHHTIHYFVAPPTGSWITPGNGQTFSGGTVHLSAHASAGGGVDHVDFTSPVGGNWHVLCGSASPAGDVYSCDINLAALPMGDIEIAFDVYSRVGTRVFSPDGHHTIHYNVPPPTGSWISPGDGVTFSDGQSILLSAHASAVDGVDHVDFTSPVGGNWHVLCGSATPSGDVYRCSIDLGSYPPGDIEIAFDVYSRGGARTLSPDGHHTIHYRVTPVAGNWITPGDGITFGNGASILLAAHANAGLGIDHVNFTGNVAGNWQVLCTSSGLPTSGDIYQCGIDLSSYPPGDIEVAFDVYPRAGSPVQSPNGHHTIHSVSRSQQTLIIVTPGIDPGSPVDNAFVTKSPYDPDRMGDKAFGPVLRALGCPQVPSAYQNISGYDSLSPVLDCGNGIDWIPMSYMGTQNNTVRWWQGADTWNHVDTSASRMEDTYKLAGGKSYGKVYVIGHSLGGAVSSYWAAMHADHNARVITLDSPINGFWNLDSKNDVFSTYCNPDKEIGLDIGSGTICGITSSLEARSKPVVVDNLGPYKVNGANLLDIFQGPNLKAVNFAYASDQFVPSWYALNTATGGAGKLYKAGAGCNGNIDLGANHGCIFNLAAGDIAEIVGHDKWDQYRSKKDGYTDHFAVCMAQTTFPSAHVKIYLKGDTSTKAWREGDVSQSPDDNTCVNFASDVPWVDVKIEITFPGNNPFTVGILPGSNVQIPLSLKL